LPVEIVLVCAEARRMSRAIRDSNDIPNFSYSAYAFSACMPMLLMPLTMPVMACAPSTPPITVPIFWNMFCERPVKPSIWPSMRFMPSARPLTSAPMRSTAVPRSIDIVRRS